MAKTKEELRKYKKEWAKKHFANNVEYRKKQNEKSAANNAKLRDSKVYKIHVDLSGRIFGKLTVIKLFEYYRGGSTWVCKCECGNEILVKRPYLICGDTRSCGCIREEKPNSKTHGESGNGKRTKEYSCWCEIKSRCTNKKSKGAKNYVGRGVRMCDRWFSSYEAFLEDVGRAPTKIHTLDRFPDNNGNYEPKNVRWATPKQQANNTRSNVVLEYSGVSKTKTEWAEQLGISYHRVHYLIKRKGLTIKDVIEKYELLFTA